MTRWPVLGFAVLLAACGSSPKTQFYTLDPVSPLAATQAVPTPVATSVPVQVASVHIPPALDRQEIVRETAPHQLDISDQNRWGGSLDNMVQRVLTQDLAQRLPPSGVVLPQEPAPARHDAIVVDILQFDEDAGGAVVFDGSWSLTASDSDKPLSSRHVRLSAHAASSSYSDQVAAMSKIVGELSDNIARDLASAPVHVAR
ncbi:MAG TPA: PqiC family protein [Stellaceae bacterium]|nr:PqiC family protein [Stellaceae bacterium]